MLLFFLFNINCTRPIDNKKKKRKLIQSETAQLRQVIHSIAHSHSFILLLEVSSLRFIQKEAFEDSTERA